MTRAVMQLWEESEKNGSVRPSGCSLHPDVESRDKYVKSMYSNRDKIPEYYERAIGEPIDVMLINNLLRNAKTVKLMRQEMNNLLNMEEILPLDI